jgi:hypothetical protein
MIINCVFSYLFVAMVSAGVSLVERKQAALLGLFIGDALSMPTHWYYDVKNIQKAYGSVKGFVKPDDEMEGGYMGKIPIGGGAYGHAGYQARSLVP